MTGTTLRRFRNRSEAGRLLADELREYSGREDVIVLGLPRGGVPVGYEIARALAAPLDVFVVRKLGIPGQEEAAFGAIATPEPVREISVRPLTGVASDLDPLIARARWKSFVLLGEPSHGTHESYRYRAEITRRLITEGSVTAVAVEADWPDAYRVNAYVRGKSDDRTAEAALSGFRRFPAWMWRNTEVAEFVRWLRDWNDALPAGATKVGFYGLDLYSLHASIEAVVQYLERVDPDAAQRARERYACFEQFGRDPQVYAYEAGIGGAEPCEEQAIEQLLELRDMAAERASQDGHIDEDGQFYAEQNARLVVDAEEYYRSMFRGGVESWNLRDRHMADTLER